MDVDAVARKVADVVSETVKAKSIAEMLTEHYQKTYELTYSLWDHRGKSFLILLALACVEILLIFRTPQITGVMADTYNKLLDASPKKSPDDIVSSLPFDLLQSILLVAILYLMINIYYRTSYILRSYQYLSRLEGRIRSNLSITDQNDVSFTREGEFYWKNREVLQDVTKYVYMTLLGILLLFIGYGVFFYPKSNIMWDILNILVFLATAAYFLFYLVYAIVNDQRGKMVSTTESTPAVERSNEWSILSRRQGSLILKACIPGLIFGLIILIVSTPEQENVGVVIRRFIAYTIVFAVLAGIWTGMMYKRGSI